MKLISFSLFGHEPRYLSGALENVRLAREYYPGWACRFYCGPEVDARPLLAEGAEVRRETALGPYHGLFWRFFPASEPGVERFIVRDADSRLNPREAAAVAEWEASGRAAHVMRDHVNHVVPDSPILSGMWGGRGGLHPDIRALVRRWGRFQGRFCDQEFLARHIWPRVKHDCLQHNGVPSPWGGVGFPHSPLPEGAFVGQQVEPGSGFESARPVPKEPPLVTLIAIPKPSEGHIGVIQENALHSWCQLSPRPDIVLIGDEPGTAEAARRFGAVHMPEVARNRWGTPLYHDLLMRGQAAARTELVCHINADIILLDDFCLAALQARAAFSRFLMLGRRTDLAITRPLDFTGTCWREELRREMARGEPGGPTGVEFFLFPRWLLTNPPQFAIGRYFHDSWPIANCRQRGIAVVDATEAVTVAHQRHGYNQASAPARNLSYEEFLRLPEDGENYRLLGGEGRRFSIRHATHRLGPGGLRRVWCWPYRVECLRNLLKLWQRRLEGAVAQASLSST